MAREGVFLVLTATVSGLFYIDKMEALKLRIFFSLLAKFSCFSEILSVIAITYRESLPSYQYR